MKFYVTEDERWPTLLAEIPDNKMLGQSYWNDKIFDIDEQLVVELENAHRKLEAAENALRVAMGQKPKKVEDSWYFPKHA